MDDPESISQVDSSPSRESVVDLHIPGRGLDFTWARTYRSRTGSNTAAGNGWDFSCNVFVEQYGAALFVHDGAGRRDLYRPQSITLSDHIRTMDGFFR